MACYVVLLTMAVAGVLGGSVNVALSAEIPSKRTWFMSILAGVAASLLIATFLRTLSSNILSNIMNPKNSMSYVSPDLLVFGGFCLLAAISSKAFIQT